MNKHPAVENTRDAAPVDEPAPKARKAKAAKRTCIMVLGMHRSGTSALTRAINLLGAELPKDSIPADSNNANGYWEPTRLTLLNDQMLIEAGSRWDDWRPFDPDSLSTSRAEFYKAEIARIIGEEYGDDALIVLKEPRISRFVPLYGAILASMNFQVRYVLTVRNPLSVIASLKKRDGMTSAFGSLLWLRYVLDAERATRGTARAFLSYESLIADWYPSIARIGETLSIGWPRTPAEAKVQIDDFISAEHQHHLASVERLLADEVIPEWAKDTYLAVRSLEKDAHDQEALARLDQIKAGFDAGTRQFGAACILELNARQSAFTENVSALENRNAEKDGAIKVLADDSASLRAQVEALAQRESAQNQLLLEKEHEIRMLAEETTSLRAQAEAPALREIAQNQLLIEKEHEIGMLAEKATSLLAQADALAQRESAQGQLLVEKDKEISRLTGQEKIQKTQSDALERQLIELERATALDREAMLQRQMQLVAESEEKTKEAELLSVEIGNIYRSRTWRVSIAVSRIFSHLKTRLR